jgi:hypothetical protein
LQRNREESEIAQIIRINYQQDVSYCRTAG